MPLSKAEWFKAGLILTASVAVMWALMVQPHSYTWQAQGETTGEVRTLLSNSNVLGSPQIKAVIDLSDGRNTIITVPMRSDVRAGDRIELTTFTATENPKKTRYQYKAKVLNE